MILFWFLFLSMLTFIVFYFLTNNIDEHYGQIILISLLLGIILKIDKL
ncbi:hypothetical protein ABID96_000854 [Bacillus sp. OAE603]